VPLLEASHPGFELSSPDSSSESLIKMSLLLPIADSSTSEGVRELDRAEESEAEGGVTGAMDSTDDD
jgi:hypothetical protein